MIEKYAGPKAKANQYDNVEVNFTKEAGFFNSLGSTVDSAIEGVKSSDTFQNAKSKVKDWLGSAKEKAGKTLEETGKKVKNDLPEHNPDTVTSGENALAANVTEDYDWLEDPDYKEKFQETEAFSDKEKSNESLLNMDTPEPDSESTLDALDKKHDSIDTGDAGSMDAGGGSDFSVGDLDITEGSDDISDPDPTLSSDSGDTDIKLKSLSKTGALLKRAARENSLKLDTKLRLAQQNARIRI